MLNRQTLGQQAENLALQYLNQQGLMLIESNYRRPFGEIDLIMQDRGPPWFLLKYVAAPKAVLETRLLL